MFPMENLARKGLRVVQLHCANSMNADDITLKFVAKVDQYLTTTKPSSGPLYHG